MQADVRFAEDAVRTSDIFPWGANTIVAVLDTGYVEGVFFACLCRDLVDPVVCGRVELCDCFIVRGSGGGEILDHQKWNRRQDSDFFNLCRQT